jgi:ABC-type bacteriocin/lantibiotic exporter with double-glycine peptidase domain
VSSNLRPIVIIEILILDEDTSNVDSAIEREILNSLKNIVRDITIIQISHKVITIPDTEKIIYLKEGHISAAGTFLKSTKPLRTLESLPIQHLRS